MLVSGSSDGTMRFWDMRQKKMTESDVESPQQICKQFRDAVTHVIVEGAHILTGCTDGYMRHFDVRAGECTSDYIGGTRG